MYVRTYVRTYVYIYVNMCIYIYIYTYVCVCLCDVCVCVCACVESMSVCLLIAKSAHVRELSSKSLNVLFQSVCASYQHLSSSGPPKTHGPPHQSRQAWARSRRPAIPAFLPQVAQGS